MRLENIKVNAWIQAPTRSPVYHSPSLSIDGNVVTLVTDVGKGQSKTVAFDGVYEEGSLDEIISKSEDEVCLNLKEGISVGMVRIDGGSPSDSRQSLFTQPIKWLSSLTASVSYRLLSVTDAHCIDLVDFSQIDSSRLSEMNLDEWDAEFVQNTVEKGYSGSCILWARVRDENADGRITISHFMVADICAGSGLEKSMATLKNLLLSMDQPYGSGDISFGQSDLTAILEPFLLTASTKVFTSLVNHSAGVETKSLLSAISLSEAFRRIKTRPTATIEPAEVSELARLVEAHNSLQSEQHVIKQQAKNLRKQLNKVTNEREKLSESARMSACEGEVAVLEREWKMAKLALANIDLSDQLRRCEAKLVWMEHERSLLQANIHEQEYKCSQIEESLRQSTLSHQEESAKNDSLVQDLQSTLKETKDQLEKSVSKLERENREAVKKADYKTAQLEASLAQTESNRKKLEGELEDSKKKWTAELKQLTEQEKKTVREMEQAISKAKESEKQISAELASMQKDRQKAQGTIETLEREIGQLRIENATLSAKLDIYMRHSTTTQQQQQSQQQQQKTSDLEQVIAAYDRRLAEERKAMKSMIDDAIKSNRHEEAKAVTAERTAEEKILKMVKSVPAKRSAIKKAPAVVENDDVGSGPEDEPVAAPVKKPATIKLKPKKIPQPEAVKENKQPAETPQLFLKSTPVPSTPSVSKSPIKARSTFIPTVAKPSATDEAPTETVPKPTAASTIRPKFLANMKFGSAASSSVTMASAGAGKKIKLPERASQTIAPTATATASHARRNIDPAVYSAIVSGFSIKK